MIHSKPILQNRMRIAAPQLTITSGDGNSEALETEENYTARVPQASFVSLYGAFSGKNARYKSFTRLIDLSSLSHARSTTESNLNAYYNVMPSNFAHRKQYYKQYKMLYTAVYTDTSQGQAQSLSSTTKNSKSSIYFYNHGSIHSLKHYRKITESGYVLSPFVSGSEYFAPDIADEITNKNGEFKTYLIDKFRQKVTDFLLKCEFKSTEAKRVYNYLYLVGGASNVALSYSYDSNVRQPLTLRSPISIGNLKENISSSPGEVANIYYYAYNTHLTLDDSLASINDFLLATSLLLESIDERVITQLGRHSYFHADALKKSSHGQRVLQVKRTTTEKNQEAKKNTYKLMEYHKEKILLQLQAFAEDKRLSYDQRMILAQKEFEDFLVRLYSCYKIKVPSYLRERGKDRDEYYEYTNYSPQFRKLTSLFAYTSNAQNNIKYLELAYEYIESANSLDEASYDPEQKKIEEEIRQIATLHLPQGNYQRAYKKREEYQRRWHGENSFEEFIPTPFASEDEEFDSYSIVLGNDGYPSWKKTEAENGYRAHSTVNRSKKKKFSTGQELLLRINHYGYTSLTSQYSRATAAIHEASSFDLNPNMLQPQSLANLSPLPSPTAAPGLIRGHIYYFGFAENQTYPLQPSRILEEDEGILDSAERQLNAGRTYRNRTQTQDAYQSNADSSKVDDVFKNKIQNTEYRASILATQNYPQMLVYDEMQAKMITYDPKAPSRAPYGVSNDLQQGSRPSIEGVSMRDTNYKIAYKLKKKKSLVLDYKDKKRSGVYQFIDYMHAPEYVLGSEINMPSSTSIYPKNGKSARTIMVKGQLKRVVGTNLLDYLVEIEDLDSFSLYTMHLDQKEREKIYKQDAAKKEAYKTKLYKKYKKLRKYGKLEELEYLEKNEYKEIYNKLFEILVAWSEDLDKQISYQNNMHLVQNDESNMENSLLPGTAAAAATKPEDDSDADNAEDYASEENDNDSNTSIPN